jgi:hypothetical protein
VALQTEKLRQTERFTRPKQADSILLALPEPRRRRESVIIAETVFFARLHQFSKASYLSLPACIA